MVNVIFVFNNVNIFFRLRFCLNKAVKASRAMRHKATVSNMITSSSAFRRL